MEATLTLNQAGEQMGVDDATLTRLIRMGALPEARRQPADDGAIWVIPERVLPSVAARNGWTIDLRGARAAVRPPAAAQAPQVEQTSTGEASITDGDPTTEGESLTERTAVIENEAVTETEAVTEGGAAIDGDAATEAEIRLDEGGRGALVLRGEHHPEAGEQPTALGAPSVSEVVDLALLDRLLGAQEQRVVAESQVREARNALSALNTAHNRATSELEIERHERMVVADRFREERLARAAADAKVTELRNRVTREMALAEAERQAKAEAVYRSAKAERDAANAFAVLGWLGRRRYRRIAETAGES